eukprot:CCRYP_010342-RA/>CCRYP_010342-RA protein AED:0.05 eAED:0.06 QI:0/0/0.5/1/0/0/2/221/339
MEKLYVGEVSSHLPQLTIVATSKLLYHGPPNLPSLISTAALVPTFRPEQAALQVFEDYRTLLAIHPLSTKVVTGAILALAGDAVAQGQDKGDLYNPARGASFAAFDMTYRAVQHYLFPVIIDRCQGHFFLGIVQAVGLSQVLGNVDVLATLERSLANQLVVVPFFYYPVFFLFTGCMQGLTLSEGVDRAKQNFVPLMKRNLLYWIPIQYAQFAFVPLDLQIPFLCVAGLVWTYILSILAGSTKKYSNDAPESDETYCVIGTEDNCVLPEDELIPIPDRFSNEESDLIRNFGEDASVVSAEHELLSATDVFGDFGVVGVPEQPEFSKNDTVADEMLLNTR